jgi:predicted aminopeptidase
VLHELFHATLFVPGAAAFNESAATFVGHRGAIAYFCAAAPDTEACAVARRRWEAVRRHGRVVGRYATRLRALYATAGAGPARDVRRGALARLAGAALERHRAGRASELVPPNNARLLGMLVYETDLDAFERGLAAAGSLPDAIRTIVAAAREAADPFAAVRALGGVANGPAPIRLDDACRPSPSPSTRCSGVWPDGCASSATMRPTARTSTGRRWPGWRAARAG